jgi:hypothetical protein
MNDPDGGPWTDYTPLITRWLPRATLTAGRPSGKQPQVTVRAKEGRWVALVRPHFANQDAAMVADRLRQLTDPGGGRALLLAPYVRQAQAQVLQDAGIDYVDLAGNAHIETRERFVHVEGKRPLRVPPRRLRLTKGWVKTVMALLVEPGLLNQPYRTVALRADVAVGTVTACLKHLREHRYLAVRGADRQLNALPDLVALWVAAYGDIVRPRLAERRLQVPAGEKHDVWERLRARLAERKIGWALTGADAAERTEGHFHAETTEIYAPVTPFDDRHLLLALPAQPARGGNLLVIEPPGPLALDTRDAGIPIAPLLLQYAELRYRATEQAGEAADLLLPKLLTHAKA